MESDVLICSLNRVLVSKGKALSSQKLLEMYALELLAEIYSVMAKAFKYYKDGKIKNFLVT